MIASISISSDPNEAKSDQTLTRFDTVDDTNRYDILIIGDKVMKIKKDLGTYKEHILSLNSEGKVIATLLLSNNDHQTFGPFETIAEAKKSIGGKVDSKNAWSAWESEKDYI